MKQILNRSGLVFLLTALSGCGQIPNPLMNTNPEVYNRGVRRLEVHDIPGSQAAFDQAISLHREDLSLYAQIANEYMQADQPVLAAKYADQGLAAVPTAPVVERCALLSIASAARLDAGDHVKALDLATAAYNLQPDNPLTQNGLAYTLAETVEVDDPLTPAKLVKAETLLGTALNRLKTLDVTPEQMGVVLDSLGWVHFKMRRFKDAVLELERADDLSPGQAEITYHLGMAYLATNRLNEATTAFKRALAIKPGLLAAKSALNAIVH